MKTQGEKSLLFKYWQPPVLVLMGGLAARAVYAFESMRMPVKFIQTVVQPI
jgi:hypothetical protein